MGLHILSKEVQSEWTASPVEVEATEAGPENIATLSFEVGERDDGATGHHFSITGEKAKLIDTLTEAIDQIHAL